jgi:shikimate 5-dehydrogenase
VLINCTAVGLDSGIAAADAPQRPAPASRAPRLEPSATEVAELNQLSLTFDLVGEYSYVIDMVYRSSETALCAAGRAGGAQVRDGLHVLVAQGALSLERWTGLQAPTELMLRAASGTRPAG